MSFISFITGRGKEVKKVLEEGRNDYSSALAKFTSGTVLKVRIPSDDMYVTYGAHSVFKVFHTTPCVKPAGQKCAYCEASETLYKRAWAAKDAGDDDKYNKLKDDAYALKAKDRVMFGFFNLADGEPIAVDLSSKQGKALITSIEKNARRLNTYAFELAKEGSGTDTTVTLTMLDVGDDNDPDAPCDLNETERKHFKECAKKKFDESLFEKVLPVREYDDQLDDLAKFGFYFDEKATDNSPDSFEVSDDNLPF